MLKTSRIRYFSSMPKKNEELEAFKDALWDFILEHSDIERSGSFFTKFHSDGRANIERRIMARAKYGYHREDPREKERLAEFVGDSHRSNKQRAKEVWIADKKERKRIFAELAKKNQPVTQPTRTWFREFVQTYLFRTHGRVMRRPSIFDNQNTL